MSRGPTNPIPFHRPSLGSAEREAVIEVLDSGWLTTGARTAAFETAFAAYVGADHAVAVNSATAALHLALEGLGVGARRRGHRPDLHLRRVGRDGPLPRRAAGPRRRRSGDRQRGPGGGRRRRSVRGRAPSRSSISAGCRPICPASSPPPARSRSSRTSRTPSRRPSRRSAAGSPGRSGGPGRSASMPRRPSRPARAGCS